MGAEAPSGAEGDVGEVQSRGERWREQRCLLERRQQVLSRAVRDELRDVGVREEPHHVADLTDLGGDAWDEDAALRLLEREGNELLQIQWALSRIEAGTYSLCDMCGVAIRRERLLALPLATTCVACQRRLEAGVTSGRTEEVER